MNLRLASLTAGMLIVSGAFLTPTATSAQATAATCKDGTTSATTGRGACTGHGGVDKTAVAAATKETKAEKKAAKKAAAAATAATTTAPVAPVAPAPAKVAVTLTCVDGTTSPGGRGACSGHGGVNKGGFSKVNVPSIKTASKATVAPAPAPVTGAVNAPPPAPTPRAVNTTTPSRAPVVPQNRGTPGDGKVWVNTASKVYHCAGTKYYGATKAGQYMTEAEAKASGARPAYGKACS